MSGPRRVAVLGGTFDPVHSAHVTILEQVIALLDADSGRLVPSATPPHRGPAHASAEARLEMARAAVAGNPRLGVDDLEVRRGGASYTIDSLEEWAGAEPGTEFHIVLGDDAARLVQRWHRAADLLATARFVLVNRAGVGRIDVAEAAALGFSPQRTRLLQVLSPDISATDIRRRLGAGESVEGLVPEAVLAVIERDGLYGVHPRTAAIRDNEAG